jgi:hypothetical protein
MITSFMMVHFFNTDYALEVFAPHGCEQCFRRFESTSYTHLRGRIE